MSGLALTFIRALASGFGEQDQKKRSQEGRPKCAVRLAMTSWRTSTDHGRNRVRVGLILSFTGPRWQQARLGDRPDDEDNSQDHGIDREKTK
jgi:hypothetical protein